jgi:hypothetical protein
MQLTPIFPPDTEMIRIHSNWISTCKTYPRSSVPESVVYPKGFSTGMLLKTMSNKIKLKCKIKHLKIGFRAKLKRIFSTSSPDFRKAVV